MFKTRSSLVHLFFLSLLLAPGAYAAEGQFYLAPGLQWMEFDEGLDLERDTGYFVGFGYDFTDRISMEISTFDLDPETGAGQDLDLDHFKVDFLYGLTTGSALQPFLVTGLGNTNFDGENDTVWEYGVGLKYQISDRWAWRTTVRGYDYFERDHEDADVGVDTALIYYFGGNSRPAPRRQTASAPTPAAPAAPGDADRDGVIDANDDCPNTPRTYAVDERGCPIPVEEVARVELLVNFDFDRAEVKSEYFGEIQEVAEFMAQYPDVVIELEGHTDSVGTEAYNEGLSRRRASAVRDVLINRFDVMDSRVTALGFGESQPVASNDTDSGRAQNRRVVTVIIKRLQNYRPR